MSKLTWDNVGERLYEAGVEKVVLFPFNTSTNTYGNGVAWSGCTGVSEGHEGGEADAIWADDIKYANITSREDFGATITAYTYPDEFAECDGSAELATGVVVHQQKRKMFGLSYVTKIGNDVDELDHGYKIHLVYGCHAAPSDVDRETINDSVDPVEFSWEVSTLPVEVPNLKPTAHIEIDSTKVDATKLKTLEDQLYGTESGNSTLPLPSALVTIFS